MGIREYICRMQKTLETHIQKSYGLKHVPSKHTGIFLDSTTKIGSIGVQVRHRLTTHGFSLNFTREPLIWFQEVVACGLEDVHAGCVEIAAKQKVDVANQISSFVDVFGDMFERDMIKIDVDAGGEVGEAIELLEEAARKAGDWPQIPVP
jgi:lipoyl(octanoyl) transferase